MRSRKWREQSAASLDLMRGDIASLRLDLQLVLQSWMRSEDERAADAQARMLVEAMAERVTTLAHRHLDLVEALERVAESHDQLASELEAGRREQAALTSAVVRIGQALSAAVPEALVDASADPEVARILGGTVDPALLDLTNVERAELEELVPSDDSPS